MVNVSGSRSAVADAQRDMPRETQLDEEKIGMEEGVRIEAKHDYSPIEAEAIEERRLWTRQLVGVLKGFG